MPEPIKKEFLSFIEVADFLNQHGYNFDLSKSTDEDRLRQMIVELIDENKMTAVFYFDGVITHPKNPNNSQFIQDYFLCDTKIIENFAHNEPLDIRIEKPRNYYFLYREPNQYYKLTNSAKKKMRLLFPVVNLERLFDKTVKKDMEMNENQAQSKIIEAGNVEEKLSEKKIKRNSSRNYDDKLITFLAILLAEKTNQFQIKGRPNIAQISQAITNLAPLLLEAEDIYGISSPARRIGEALQNSQDILSKHYDKEIRKKEDKKN